MSKQDQSAGKRRKILEQAMIVLRETRAKIDPSLLNLMKDRISASGMAGPVHSIGAKEKKGVYSAADVDTMSLKKALPKASVANAASLYAAQMKQGTSDVALGKSSEKEKGRQSDMVPVDRQKVAAIIMEYMRLREDKKPGH